MNSFPDTNRRIIQNAVRVLEDGTWIKSTGIHDFVTHVTTSGIETSVDGGLFYLKRCYRDPKDFEEWSLFDTDSFETQANLFLWKTFGKDGKEPGYWVPLSQCELDHLKAIRDTQLHIKGSLIEKIVLHWIAEKEKL